MNNKILTKQEIEEIKNTFRKRMRERMTELAITTERFAQMLEVPQNHVEQWLCGKRKIWLQDIIDIAKNLDCSTDFLFGRSDTPRR